MPAPLLLRRPFALAALVLTFALPAIAQGAGEAVPPRADALQSPATFLGYELGDRFTPHHRVVDYVQHVAAHSPNVRWEPYGETVEGRPLGVAYVATPERLGRLDAVREQNLRAAGVLPGGAVPEASVVWLSYGVHGNESSSTEAALATLYALADPTNARTQAWLRDVVVVLDPCLNPDGRERYVDGFHRRLGIRPDADPAGWEHDEAWPGGRTNHYFFDLNRDWAWGTQQETRARLALYNRWLPHVHVDFHEQGIDAPYYFAPAAEPLHARITDWQRDLQTTIGRNHAARFDREGWLYFTGQVFDLLYPGYGDSWPMFNGAVGMTYEQAGGGRGGLAVRTAEGDTLTLTDRIAHHVATGLSTVEVAAREREAITTNFRAYYRDADRGPYRAFVVRGDAGVLAALAEHLAEQGVRAERADRDVTLRGRRYADGEDERFALGPDDLVVTTDQPKGVLASVLFDPSPVLSDSLSYDATAWALPYVYDLDGWALAEAPNLALRPWTPSVAPPPSATRPYAYLLRWTSFADARALARLFDAGVRPRVATEPFEIDGARYDRGTLVLTRRGNERIDFDAAVREAAAGQGLTAVASGLVTSGPDFGSSDVRAISAPRVALLVDDALSSSAVGEVWHYFDAQLGYPVTLLPADGLRAATLADYEVLVLPNGSYGDLLTDGRRSTLKDWVRDGGRLVALERAVAALAGEDGFAVEEREDDEAEGDTVEARLTVYGNRERDRIAEDVPGSVFRVTLDATHPLAFGYDGDTHTFKRSTAAYPFLKDGWNVGVLRSGEPVSGFAGYETGKRLEDSLAFGVQELGRGRVIYLVDDPLFRGFWYAGRLLFANAVFFGGL
ncbi:MAG: M14 family metallopeptidase [Rhodothermales bacterium]